MNIAPLSTAEISPWADLLAVSFDRKRGDMVKLLTYLQPEQQLIAWGAWDGSRLAAQYSCALRQLHLPSEHTPVLVGMSINMAVHPDYRGRGLIKQTAKPVYEALRQRGGVAGVGFSNAAGVKVDRRSKGYGYHVVGKMKPSLAVMIRAPQVEPLKLTAVFPQNIPLSPSPNQWIHFCKTWDGINGRFAAHPFRQYQFGVWTGDGGGRGVVVYKPIRLAGGRWGVSLLMAHGDNLPLLLARWLRALWQTGVRVVHLLTSPTSQIKKALGKTAVCISIPYTRHPYYLTVKPLQADSPASLLNFNQWECIGGDIL